jgi:hypothetical protein
MRNQRKCSHEDKLPLSFSSTIEIKYKKLQRIKEEEKEGGGGGKEGRGGEEGERKLGVKLIKTTEIEMEKNEILQRQGTERARVSENKTVAEQAYL